MEGKDFEMEESGEGGRKRDAFCRTEKNLDLTDKIKICVLPEETRAGVSKMPYMQCKVELREL